MTGDRIWFCKHPQVTTFPKMSYHDPQSLKVKTRKHENSECDTFKDNVEDSPFGKVSGLENLKLMFVENPDSR